MSGRDSSHTHTSFNNLWTKIMWWRRGANTSQPPIPDTSCKVSRGSPPREEQSTCSRLNQSRRINWLLSTRTNTSKLRSTRRRTSSSRAQRSLMEKLPKTTFSPSPLFTNWEKHSTVCSKSKHLAWSTIGKCLHTRIAAEISVLPITLPSFTIAVYSTVNRLRGASINSKEARAAAVTHAHATRCESNRLQIERREDQSVSGSNS